MGVQWWLDLPEGAVDPVREPDETGTLPKGTFKARYNAGVCRSCHSMILRGEVIRFRRRNGVRGLEHWTCPTTRRSRVQGQDRETPLPFNHSRD